MQFSIDKSGLKQVFDQWLDEAGNRYADRQWLLSKWEVMEGIEWPQEKIDMMMRSIQEGLSLRKGNSLVDLGCGGGWILERLRGDVKEAVGLDFCADMLKVAKKFSQGSWVQGEIGRLPFKNNSFDRALSYFVFLNFTDDRFVESGILDIYRILKKGGVALIGQLPLKGSNARYDQAKAEYVEYCSRIMPLGKRNDEGTRAPLRSFDKDVLADFLKRHNIRHEFRLSFNPFYRPGAAEKVDWRFDLAVFK
ncbi:MAG: class I SAM-dependent methyltransferase [Candidatus Omnitrophica bacterium]|nr:class I SAM-dependent methyltransferase [Candidatus Omnitrophota bacterium]